MIASAALLALFGTVVAGTRPGQTKSMYQYPQAQKGDQVDDYFGHKVADPYRWLEDGDAPETRAWIEAENALTAGYLASIPERDRIKRRLTELWDYERYSAPSREGGYYVFSRNDGLQRQAVVYKAAAPHAAPEVLLDPNTFSADGTVALGGLSFSEDGRYLAYALASSGSDWLEWRVRDVPAGTDLPDRVQWSKFSGAAWMKDGSGFFYSRYDEPTPGAALHGLNKNQKLFFHALGSPQAHDRLVYERPDQPDWGFAADVTDDGRFLLIAQSEGTDNRNRVFVQDLAKPGSGIEPFLDRFDAAYDVVGNDGTTFYVRTNKDAPRYRLVAIERDKPSPDDWRTVLAEASNRAVMEAVTMVNDQFVVRWLTDAHSRLSLYGTGGAAIRDLELPDPLGSVVELTGRRSHGEAFYAFTSFLSPTGIYRYDFASGATSVVWKPEVAFDASGYETIQTFYRSKDGTRVPLFVTAKKGLRKDSNNPVYLYGYGGFDIPVTPGYSPATAAWLEMGGIYAVANLRGGSEYGQEWYDAGRLARKQNVFDDFIAAAEFLVAEKYTAPSKLAIAGGSNGGLLVGACMTQRPELFGAALPAVGVMDMLRYHRFTIGWAWKSDYGDPDTKEGFDINIKYSPLHNLRPGGRYPATLVTTADHDDRVVPAHSFKFAARLQEVQAGRAPVLIRIETRAGHGAGKPTDKLIEERADVYAFLVRTLGMPLQEAATGPS
ncbi:MAG TPA: prolyl oligopeptidase family serine peptidase [Vicinamibacterales bacterium]|nr:prolyl oligopeptidase family serine peptidase [Vicinamibacterales bacterium]